MACYIPFGPHTPSAQLFCNNSAWQPPSVIQVHHPNPNRSLESRHKCGYGDPDPPGAGTLLPWRQPQQPIQHSAWGHRVRREILKRSTGRWSFHFINHQTQSLREYLGFITLSRSGTQLSAIRSTSHCSITQSGRKTPAYWAQHEISSNLPNRLVQKASVVDNYFFTKVSVNSVTLSTNNERI